MYSRNSFGSFYPVDSSVHRLNPVVKLLNFIVPILLMQFLTLSWWWLVLIATASVGVSIVICRFIGLKRGRSGKV